MARRKLQLPTAFGRFVLIFLAIFFPLKTVRKCQTTPTSAKQLQLLRTISLEHTQPEKRSHAFFEASLMGKKGGGQTTFLTNVGKLLRITRKLEYYSDSTMHPEIS